MAAQPIILSAVVGADRRLVIDLPPETPLGAVKLVILPVDPVSPNPARDAARSRLLAAGALRTWVDVPPDAAPLALEERVRLGVIPPGSPTSEELVNEDRGEW